ncbi:MAG TPA: magnesium transporter CorA family protein [Aquabacterium sp.]|uniref:magnesium transporter CorA family protein n=1 Tax=Aquabacterium sp. TaxID=1872578 RepID=UPI002E381765|nr:magnesium transporter CorA family protein [Aquabacterium sp.]HEX5374029.1 magnesium transporter CorA family protein [Aquabacterium sp.]
MRYFLINDGLTELDGLPETTPVSGFLWVASGRREFEVQVAALQAQLHRLTGGALVDLHISDLLNPQLPSQFDYTSWYDVLVFRRLAPGPGTERLFVDDEQGTASSGRQALASIDTSPVGFAVFDRVLLTVHPTDCSVRDFFIQRLGQMSREAPPPTSEFHMGPRGSSSRMPTSPADLMLRIVNHMVDSYLDLRRLLTRQFGYLQHELLNPHSRFMNWQALLESRNALHLLEDTCEDQRSALQEWIDSLDEWPMPDNATAMRERELLRVRSRDVHEHIERVLTHVRRLESSAESAVQMHFSAQGSRTNQIMRTLTVLTAIFLPLNLITGIFGMNFDALPLIHSSTGVLIAFALMVVVALGLVWLFWRKRYLGDH